MTLTELRQLVRDSARNAGDTTQYGESVIDYALLKLGIRFCRETRYLWTSSDLTLTSGSTALPTLPTGFLPRRAMGA